MRVVSTAGRIRDFGARVQTTDEYMARDPCACDFGARVQSANEQVAGDGGEEITCPDKV